MLVVDLEVHQVIGGRGGGKGERRKGEVGMDYGVTRVLVLDLDVHQVT